MKCAVPGCFSYSGVCRDQTFHRFPFENKELCALWLLSVRNPTLQSFTEGARQAYNTYVCSAHFLKSDFKPLRKRRVLKNTAVPSVFPDREAVCLETVRLREHTSTASQDVVASGPPPILPSPKQAPQGFAKPQQAWRHGTDGSKTYYGVKAKVYTSNSLEMSANEMEVEEPKFMLDETLPESTPSIDPSIFNHLSVVGSRGQQLHQSPPDFPVQSSIDLLLEDPKMVQGQQVDVIPPSGSWSAVVIGSQGQQLHQSPPDFPVQSSIDLLLEDPKTVQGQQVDVIPPSSSWSARIPTTPKQFRPYRPLRPPKTFASPGVVSLDSSFTSMDLGHDSSDVAYDPASSSSSQVGSEASSAPDKDKPDWKGKKWIVDESHLMALFWTCPVCAGIIDKKIATVGSRIKVTWYCHSGHEGVWSSCPSIRGMPQNNVLLASAVIFNGANFQQLEDMAALLNLQIPCKTTLNTIQSSYLLPAIDEEYNQHKEEIIRHLEGHKVHLCGDGRSDSPGHSAKYTTYSFMDDATDKVLHFELVQVSETTSSVAMEALGLKRGLDHLIGIGVDVEVLTTDRSPSIKKMLREQYAAIKHEFDIWHASKCVKKKLVSQSNRKSTRELQPWIRSITNHLWFSCASCVQDPEELKRTWKSLLNHVLGVHTWTENGQVHRCRHDPITEEQQNRKRWLTKDSEAYKVLCSIVLDKTLLKDLSQMALFKHTGQLEVFHSMMLKYTSKRNHYMYPQMRARTQLAVLDHNANTSRKQKLDSDGERCHNVVYQKLSKSYVLKKVYEDKSYNFRDDLVGRALQRRRDESVDCRDASSRLVTMDLPKNVARCEKPEKAELETGYRSRYL